MGGAGGAPGCLAPAWDITYSVTSNFTVTGTTLGAGDGVNAVGPGTVTLRFTDVGGMPGDGPAALIDYDMPVVFTKQTFGIKVETNIQNSVDGMGCEAATGMLQGGTLLKWDTCTYDPSNGNSKTSWTPDAAATGPGCANGYTSVGTVTCTDTGLGSCSDGNLMNGANAVSDTWPQPLNTFELAAGLASFSMGNLDHPPYETQNLPQQPSVETPNRASSFTWFNLAATETSRVASCFCP
jgi:hypothetical protein